MEKTPLERFREAGALKFHAKTKRFRRGRREYICVLCVFFKFILENRKEALGSPLNKFRSGLGIFVSEIKTNTYETENSGR